MKKYSIAKTARNSLRNSILATALTATAATGVLTGCTSSTGAGALGVNRKQLMMISSEQVLQLSAQSYSKTIQNAKNKNALDRDSKQVARLQRIANRLIPQVTVYRPDAVNWKWEVHTIKSDSLNAFVLPGGKIMFYTGIIDRLKLTDDEIAAIMGHEMAHALRDHARERMSNAYATQMGIGIAASAFGLSTGQAQLASMVGDLGITRPNSRTQESEADVIGLELMARAGYQPNAAINLWKKMQAASKGSPPQFLSTHPSKANRIQTLQALIPKVTPLYQQSQGGKYTPSSPASSTNSGHVVFPKYQGN